MPPVTGKRDGGNGKSLDQLRPYWQTSDGETVRLYLGEVRDVLARMPARSVQTVVTSPPYWGLRDYGTGEWEGGEEGCNHAKPYGGGTREGVSDIQRKRMLSKDDAWNQFKSLCGKCGARRVDQQIGSEPSPDCGTNGQAQCGGCFVCSMVAVFRGVRRVLRDDGVLWLNLGDSYAGGKTGREDLAGHKGSFGGRNVTPVGEGDKFNGTKFSQRKAEGIPSGNLVGVPWRVALALQADGWILRQDIIWAKPAPMPESVTNRCTKAHEYVFLLTKGEGYYYDAEAIKERTGSEVTEEEYTALLQQERDRGEDWYQRSSGRKDTNSTGLKSGKKRGGISPPGGRNKRSVWTISSQGYPGAHFATFPSKLIEPMILAGTSEKGACTVCGAPWERVVEKLGPVGGRQHGRKGGGDNPYNAEDQWGLDEGGAGANWPVKTTGWAPGCMCGSESVRPCVVLDPFVGSGTTVAVANDHGRWGVGIDLSEEYLRNHAIKRVEGALLRRPATSGLTGRVRQAVTGLGRSVEMKRGEEPK